MKDLFFPVNVTDLTHIMLGAPGGVPAGSVRRSRSHELAYLVREHGQRDLHAVGLTPDERRGEVQRLLRSDLRWQRRLERIDHAFDDDRPRGRQGLVEDPWPPHARAKSGWSIGCSSQPYSGLPRKTICSHLICPSVLFLTTTTLTGSWYFTQVANSAISIEKPPSPTNGTTCRSG